MSQHDDANDNRRTPSHKTIMYPPRSPPIVVCETFPFGRHNGTGYCKYCYTTHSDWWQMRHEDYGADVVLCGKCEHTSQKELT